MISGSREVRYETSNQTTAVRDLLPQQRAVLRRV
jgi:hypothetical protein